MAETDKLAPSFGLQHVITTLSPADANHDRLMTSFPDAIKKVEGIIRATSREIIQTYLVWTVLTMTYPKVIAPEVEPVRVFFNGLLGSVSTVFLGDDQ